MAAPVLDRLDIAGFTSIAEQSVTFGPLNVFVGANGAGKSNFIKAFELLGRVVDEDLGPYVARTGASALLNATLKTRGMQFSVRGRYQYENRYDVTLAATDDNELFLAGENVYFRRPPYDTWYHGSLGGGHRETRLHEAVATGAQNQAVASYVIGLLRGCRVYHFHDTSENAPVKQWTSTADNLSLHPDAANLAAVLLALRDGEGEAAAAYRRIVGAVRLVAPFFRDFVLLPERRDEIRLRWRQRGTDAVFSAHQMSDGTLRFTCLATLLLQLNPPSLVVLDEPELGLHPFAIVQLGELLRRAAVGHQVLVATQSVTLMNQFALEDLIVVERGAQGSEFARPDVGRLAAWIEEYSLGELWEKNLLGGRPGSLPGLAG